MNKKRLVFLIIMLSLFAFPSCTPKERTHHPDPIHSESDRQKVNFAEEFKDAVILKDKKAVAHMISYPSAIWLQDNRIVINNPEEFLPYYDNLFTDHLVDIISKSSTMDMDIWPEDFNNFVDFADGKVSFHKNVNQEIYIMIIQSDNCTLSFHFSEY